MYFIYCVEIDEKPSAQYITTYCKFEIHRLVFNIQKEIYQYSTVHRNLRHLYMTITSYPMN